MKTSRKDVFLSYAHTDKDMYVRPFARELDRRSISYWLDEVEIEWADGITAKINEGLRLSEFVVVFLSDAFVGRNWPEAELASALNRENSEGRKVVLPVIIGEASKLLTNYPLMRDKALVHWDMGIAALADALQRLKGRQWSLAELNQFILDKVNLEDFPKDAIWGPRHRLLTSRRSMEEGAYFFWNEEQRTVVRNWKDGVRWLGPEPLTSEDVQLVRSVVAQHVCVSS